MHDVPLIPRTVLFGESTVINPSLSPSGTHVAYLTPHDDDITLWVGSVVKRDFGPLVDIRGQFVRDYVWARDGRHLLYLVDRDGDENHHLMAADLTDGTVRDLTPYPGVRVNVVGMHHRVPDHVLIEMNLPVNDRMDLYRIDLRDGTCEPVPADPGLSGWIADQDLRVRAAMRRHPDGGVSVLVRETEVAAWRNVLSIAYEDAVATEVLGFTDDGKDLLLLTPLHADATRLVRLSVVDGTIDVLYGDRQHDVVGVSTHPVTGELDFVVVERERTELIALTEGAEADLALVQRLTHGDVSVLGRTGTNGTWLVQDNVDNGPAAYQLIDMAAGTGEVLFVHQPDLLRYRLARVEPFSFTARDGLTIHGYLTFPPGRRDGLPAVLNVHGGPWERNRWGMRAESQWLANRGYLVIEVNYRGSTGFGKAFELAGDREWGGKMQDDLIDAVRWTIDRGFADPRRIGVHGASYGGYAALVGAAFTPDQFRCAVAVAAPVNLCSFIESVPAYWTSMGARLVRRVGNPSTDRDFLWSRSPLSRVGDIRIPVLLVYGENDPRVPVSEAEQMVAAMTEHGVEHEYLLFSDEGHGMLKQSNALRFRAATERFLAAHLGGRAESEERCSPT